ncbi:hypothetical protein ZWY2020_045317 [Hordeum vulgare]|nr:hypothetical protein ZWY2020_045317 [Hordeum vulgare]
MAPSSSASGTDDGDGDGEPQPCPCVVSLAHLLQGPDAALPQYLTLSLTPADIELRRPTPPEEVTLRHINAPPGYLSLTMDEEEEPTGPSDPAAADAHTSSNGGSLVVNDASLVSRGAAEAALAHAATANNVLPPKKRKLADCNDQETATANSSPSLSLAIVIHGDYSSRPSTSSTHGGGDVETRSITTMAVEPIDAVPLRAAYFAGPPEPEPAWVRETLGLPVNHPLYFVASKVIENSDMNGQQSRFLIPRAIARLRPLLSDKQRIEANMVEEEPARKKKKPTAQPSGCDGVKPRMLGKKHGGLLVHVVVNRDGHQMDAELTTWDSSHTSVLKFGKNHQRFVGMSGLKLKEKVHIWALLHPDGDLYLVITTPPHAGQPVAECDI